MPLGGTRARFCAKPPEKNIERQSTRQETRWHDKALTVPTSRVPAALAPATTRRPGGHSGGGGQADTGGSCSPRRAGAWGRLGCSVVATGRAATGALSDPTLLAQASFPHSQVTSAHMPVARHVRGNQSGSGPTPGRWARLWALHHPLGARSATHLARCHSLCAARHPLGAMPMAGPCAFPWAPGTCAPRGALCPPLGAPSCASRSVSRWCSAPRWACRPPQGVPSPAGRAVSRSSSVSR